MRLHPSGYDFTILLLSNFDAESAKVWKKSAVAISRDKYGVCVGFSIPWNYLTILD